MLKYSLNNPIDFKKKKNLFKKTLSPSLYNIDDFLTNELIRKGRTA